MALAALVFTNASTSEDLIDEARILQSSEAALGANDLALKALAQAVLLAEDEMLGVADAETVTVALNEATRTIVDLDTVVAGLQAASADPTALREATRPVIESSNDVVSLISAGRVEEAGALLSGSAKSQFEVLRDTLESSRNDSSTILTDARKVSGLLANLARYALALLIPAVAILAYRSMARRQLRYAEVELDARLDAEKEVVRAKDEFIANISHELRTPLTSIFGFSSVLLEQGVVDPEMASELISLINTESGELNRLVEDLLTSARAESDALTFQIEPVRLPAELDSVMVQLSRAGAAARVDCSDSSLLADPLRLRQILRNLLSNAQRHGGTDIQVIGRVLGGSYVFAVADDGPGVPPEMEPRLFSRFIHQGDDPLTKGSIGLGLAVVKALVEGMNGTVVYDRSDGFTRFIVRLPLAPSPTTPATTEPNREISSPRPYETAGL